MRYDVVLQFLQGLYALRRHSNSSVTAGAVCVTTTLFSYCRGCVRYDIIQSLQGLCALRHFSILPGAVCVSTFFNPCRGCVRYDDILILQSLQGCVRYDVIIQSLQGLCALRHYSILPGAVCFTTTLLYPSRDCVRYNDILQLL